MAYTPALRSQETRNRLGRAYNYVSKEAGFQLMRFESYTVRSSSFSELNRASFGLHDQPIAVGGKSRHVQFLRLFDGTKVQEQLYSTRLVEFFQTHDAALQKELKTNLDSKEKTLGKILGEFLFKPLVGEYRLARQEYREEEEPRERYCDSEDRPDISIIDPETGCDMELDVSLSHPWCVDILPKAAREDGAAAARREEKKVEKYKSKRLPGGVILNFVPLVMEHFGRWGLEAQKFLSYLSQLCKSINIDSSPQEFTFVIVFRREWCLKEN